jgi:hypothetical protein
MADWPMDSVEGRRSQDPLLSKSDRCADNAAGNLINTRSKVAMVIPMIGK